MTEEVKKALAWWRAGEITAEGDMMRNACILADAFVELHPPDDDEPVTGEWVSSEFGHAGHKAFDGPYGWNREFIYMGVDVFIIGPGDDDGICLVSFNDSEENWPRPIRTRGQLRRLIAALEE